MRGAASPLGFFTINPFGEAKRQRHLYHGAATLPPMLRPWSITRVQSELRSIEASAERAGLALACVFSNSEEFEAARIRDRADMLGARLIGRMQIVLAATSLAGLAAFAAVIADLF
jgi:hypothetical protein